jgi:hypothetical protein
MRRYMLGLPNAPEDGDPMSGAANLVDTAMVFVFALLNMTEKDCRRYQGTRMGTAYQLECGQVVYVTENAD